MPEFWENAFQEKQWMWGESPTVSAREAANEFKHLGLRKILIKPDFRPTLLHIDATLVRGVLGRITAPPKPGQAPG